MQHHNMILQDLTECINISELLELLLFPPLTGKTESSSSLYYYRSTGDLLLIYLISKLSRLLPLNRQTQDSSPLEQSSLDSVNPHGNVRITYLQFCQFININLFGLVFTIFIKPIFCIFQLQRETISILKQSIQNR